MDMVDFTSQASVVPLPLKDEYKDIVVHAIVSFHCRPFFLENFVVKFSRQMGTSHGRELRHRQAGRGARSGAMSK
jgi:hypothetical protein